jgi:hypothetical protein
MNSKTHIESEPRVGGTEENLAVLQLGEVGPEVASSGLGSIDLKSNGGLGIVNVTASSEESFDIGGGLLDVALDVHGETRSLGERKTEVERDGSRDGTETNEQTPAEVKVVSIVCGVIDDLGLERGDNDERDNGSRELSPPLRSEDGSHHATTDAGRSVLGSDGSRERVVTTLLSQKDMLARLHEPERMFTRTIPIPMMNRHMTRTPMMEMAGPWPETAWARVATMMIIWKYGNIISRVIRRKGQHVKSD